MSIKLNNFFYMPLFIFIRYSLHFQLKSTYALVFARWYSSWAKHFSPFLATPSSVSERRKIKRSSLNLVRITILTTCRYFLPYFQKYRYPLIMTYMHLVVKFILAGIVRTVLTKCHGKERKTLDWKTFALSVGPVGKCEKWVFFHVLHKYLLSCQCESMYHY